MSWSYASSSGQRYSDVLYYYVVCGRLMYHRQHRNFIIRRSNIDSVEVMTHRSSSVLMKACADGTLRVAQRFYNDSGIPYRTCHNIMDMINTFYKQVGNDGEYQIYKRIPRVTDQAVISSETFVDYIWRTT